MSAATIQLKIDSAKKESEKYCKSEYSWQEKMDNLLDRMNELNGLLTKMQELLLRLTFEIERDSEGFKQSERAPESIKALTTIISKILIHVRRSDLYPGVKTIYSFIKAENGYLKELLHDREIGLELDKDPEMHTIVSKTLGNAGK